MKNIHSTLTIAHNIANYLNHENCQKPHSKKTSSRREQQQKRRLNERFLLEKLKGEGSGFKSYLFLFNRGNDKYTLDYIISDNIQVTRQISKNS